MSETEHLRSFFDRWNHLEADKAAVSDDLRELFAEMKGVGFDAKAARIAFRERAKAEDATDGDRAFTALVGLYIAALEAPASRAHAQARDARIREGDAKYDPETGEIRETSAAASLAAQAPDDGNKPASPPLPSGGGAFPDIPASLDRRRAH